MHAASQPAMLERLVQLQPRCLNLHPSLPSIRRTGAPTHKAVNLFLDVDKRWFHDTASISPLPAPRKPDAETKPLVAADVRRLISNLKFRIK